MKTGILAWNTLQLGQFRRRIIVREGKFFEVLFGKLDKETFVEAELAEVDGIEKGDKLDFTPQEFMTLPSEIQIEVGDEIGQSWWSDQWTGEPGKARFRAGLRKVWLVLGAWLKMTLDLLSKLIPAVAKVKQIIERGGEVVEKAEEIVKEAKSVSKPAGSK